MRRSLLLAGLLVSAAALAGCGARADLPDNPLSSGSGGTGGAGGTGSAGHGTSAANGTSSGPGVTVGSGPGTTSSSGPGTTSSSGGPGTSSASSGPGSSSASSGPGSSSASGGQLCPGFGGCSSCVAASCPKTWCDCYNNPECLAIFTCDSNCNGDPKCEQGCLTAHPSGISQAYLVTDCAGAFCPAQCPGNKPVNPCTKCILTNCPAAMNACLAEPECLLLYNCLQACGPVNLACQQACYQAHGAGVPTLQAVLTCTDTVCKMECN